MHGIVSEVDLICVIRKEIRLYALKYQDQLDIPTSVLFPYLVFEYRLCLFIFTQKERAGVGCFRDGV
jgi:hypothetical protein